VATRRSRQRRRQQPATPETSLELFLDAMIRHQVGLLRYASGLGRRTNALLDDTEADLRGQLRARLRRSGVRSPAQVERMKRLLAEIREIRGQAWDEVDVLFAEEMRELVKAEPKFVDAIVKTVVPVSLKTKIPDARRLSALATTLPFAGENLRQHVRRIRVADLRRLESQVRVGLTQGETIPEISRRLVGTIRLKGRNGVTEVTRKQAISLARTATSAFANAATRQWSLENQGIVDRDLFVATLDSRTTKICASLDGETFPVEQSYPQLPLHFGERSRRIPMVDPEPIGKRPMNPTTRKQLLREYAKANGFEPTTRRADLPYGHKGKFDEFARRRVREMIGRVPAKTSYQTFLERQPAWFQDDYLGKTKGRLFRRGGLELPAFVDERGLERSLADLAQIEPEAFRRAGLDPEDFFEFAE